MHTYSILIAAGTFRAMSTPPNIVLITCDQLRPFELTCYGGDQIATPNIDKLAARGAVWEKAITNFPVCMAARSVMISGQHNRTATGGKTNVSYPSHKGDFAMPEYPYPSRPHLKAQTLPETLRDLGYDTHTIGKWHIHSWPHEIGFDHYLIPRVHHAHSAQPFIRDGGPEFVPQAYSVDFEASEVARFLQTRSSADKPFFLYYNLSPPHCPIADMPDEFLNMYDPDSLVLRENTNEAAIENKSYWYRVYRWDFRYYALRLPHTMSLPDGYNLQHLAAEYFGSVTWMDRAVGRALDALTESGLEENTVVMFISDHGENLGAHGHVQKGTENDESIRIPMIMAGPGVQAGSRVSDAVASLVDLAPSFVEVAGGEVPAHFHGNSLWRDLEGHGNNRAAFFETTRGAGLRSPDKTFVLPRNSERLLGAQPIVAFDNAVDPYQYNNVSQEVAWPSIEHSLRHVDAMIPWSELDDDPQ